MCAITFRMKCVDAVPCFIENNAPKSRTRQASPASDCTVPFRAMSATAGHARTHRRASHGRRMKGVPVGAGAQSTRLPEAEAEEECYLVEARKPIGVRFEGRALQCKPHCEGVRRVASARAR